MKSDRTERSSDLESARASSRRLAPGRSSGAGAAAEASDYVRFTFSSVVARRTVALGPPPVPAPPEATALDAATTWDDFLARSLPAAGAKAAFLMDDQGLLVASCGPIPATDLEGVGARLMAAMEHARRMQLEEGREPAVVVELGSAWLTGFAVSLRDGATLTMGVIGPAALHAEARAPIAAALVRWRASVDVAAGGEGAL